MNEALAACRAGDELVVTKLDRLARSLPDARDIADELTRRHVKLNLGGRQGQGPAAGKQSKLSPMQEAHLVALYRAGAHTDSELEELFAVTRSTVCRAVRRAGARASASDAAWLKNAENARS